MAKTIDLHMHSMYSEDGIFTVGDLVRQCNEAGIKIMAIADHNTYRANEEAILEAEKYDIKYIPAIEVDCKLNGFNFHVIGYGIDYNDEEFKIIEQELEAQSVEASKFKLKATREMGFDVNEEDMIEVSKDCFWKKRWSGERFAEVLLSKEEYINNDILKPYRKGGSRSDNPYVNFYWDYYSQGKPCYYDIVYPEMKNIIDTIHSTGGKAVLAHPAVNLKGNYELFDEIVKLGIDGVEVFSSYHNEDNRDYFYRRAKENGLFVTCGSDYHGKTKPSIKIGGHNCFLTDEEMKKEIEGIL